MKEKISNDIKEAMKSKDTVRLSALRMILAELVNKEKEKGIPVTEEQAVQVLQSMVRKRKDAIEQFRAAGRHDLADKETAEVAVIQSYLPEQLSEDEIRTHVRTAIAELHAHGPKDMGKVMGMLTKKLAGRVSGSVLSSIVKEELQKL
ncbi:MAG: GatB/YqeY domain-containing protein [Desulfobacterota bacterium]|nr:GatB/YqeY domain-containing protein [Thermodesulfobacteriota bacterium]